LTKNYVAHQRGHEITGWPAELAAARAAIRAAKEAK
jgi:hypothetical protein